MQDEITTARRKKRRRYNLKRFLWFVVALVLVLFGTFIVNTITRTTFLDIGDFFTVAFSTNGSHPVTLGSSSPLQAEKMAMSYTVVTQSELLTFSSRGASLLQVQHGFLNPCIDTSGNRIALFSVGNRSLSVYNRSRHLADIQTDYAIVDASVASDGTVAVLTQSERYNCQVDVYRGGRYENAMTWLSSNGYPLGVAIRNDGALVAALRVKTDDSGIVTVVSVIHVQRQEQIYECELSDLGVGVYFEGENLIVVTDRGAVLLDGNGAVYSETDFGMLPLLCIVQDKGPVAVALGDNNRSQINMVIVYDQLLGEQCLIQNPGPVNDLFISGNRLYILGDRIISEYNLRGDLLRQYVTQADTVMVLDLNGIIAIHQDSALRINTYIREEE